MVAAEGAEGIRPVLVLGNRALNGQERGNVEVARALQEAGADPLVATSAWWGQESVQPHLNGLGVGWTPVPYAAHFTKRLQLRAWPKNLRQVTLGSAAFGRALWAHRATHVHLANPHYALCVLPALMRTRLPVVYRLGDEPTLHHPLYRTLWSVLTRRVSRFVCVSEFVRRSAEASGVPAHKLTVIYSHPPQRPAPAGSYSAPPFEGLTFAYVGQIAPHKGVDLFVDVALRLCAERRDVRFLIAGYVYRGNAFGMELFTRVVGAGMAERVRFLGYVEDVPGLLAGADVHVCPSVGEEPLANTVVEAKAAGVPSVVFASGGLPELITDGVDGAVVGEKTGAALYTALKTYAEMDAERRCAQGVAARNSLETLGITEEAFTRAWVGTYLQTSRSGNAL